MAIVTVNDASLSAIAGAIREKLDVETTYLPSQMAAAIESIETGVDLTSEDEGKVVVESSGEYVLAAQTQRSISQNGTYDTTTNDEVNVNVSGGSTLTTKTITQNGTYNASSDSADGYSSVTVSVQGGGSDLLYDFNFQTQEYTKEPTFYSISPNTNGLQFTESGEYVSLIYGAFVPDVTLIIDVGEMNMESTEYHRSLITFINDNIIFGYRNTGVWSFYVSAWKDTSITTLNAFSNKEIAISLGRATNGGYCELGLYIDGVQSATFSSVTASAIFGLVRVGNQRSGSSGGNISGTTVKRVRMVRGNPYASN